jgi:hypothetical protein
MDNISGTHTEVYNKTPTPEYDFALAEALAKLHAHCWGPERLHVLGEPIPSAQAIERYVEVAGPPKKAVDGVGHATSVTGFYTLSQLPRLNRILTLKELGFPLAPRIDEIPHVSGPAYGLCFAMSSDKEPWTSPVWRLKSGSHSQDIPTPIHPTLSTMIRTSIRRRSGR